LEQQLREQLEERLSQAGVQQLDELSRSTESDSGFDSSSTTATSGTPATAAGAGAVTSGKPVTTKLRALPPPPLSPTKTTTNSMPTPPVQADDVNIWACKFLRDLDSLMAAGDKLPPHLAALAEGSGSGSASSSPTSRTAPILLSAAASAAIQSRLGKGSSSIMEHQLQQQQQQQNGLVLKPEKHVSTQFKILCK